MAIMRALLPLIAVCLLVVSIMYFVKNRKISNKKENTDTYQGEGMAIGMCLGTAVGVAMGRDHIAVSLAIGMLLGMVIGMNIEKS